MKLLELSLEGYWLFGHLIEQGLDKLFGAAL